MLPALKFIILPSPLLAFPHPKIIAFSFSRMEMEMIRILGLICTCCLLVLIDLTNGVELVNVTLIRSAVSKGAVCLDGSPPGYAMSAGTTKNWVLYMEGGAWCETMPDCIYRSISSDRGSSFKRKNISLAGILDNNKTFNPDFYNWNRVYLIYCDGSSFLGDVDHVDPETKVFYRGSRVFDAIIGELLSKGMNTADNVILSGGSAGGLATILHCDRFRALLPHAGRVKCISDSGFFLHAKNLPRATDREDYFYKVIKLHGLEIFLPESCKSSQRNLSLCLFPEYLVDHVKTPLFLLESSFDRYQMIKVYNGSGSTDWTNCLLVNIEFCNSAQLKILQEFQKTFIHTLHNLDYSSTRGMFVHTCYQHTHIHSNQYWKSPDIVLHHETIAHAVGDWYFDRKAFQHIDTCNKTPRNCPSTYTFGEDTAATSKKCLKLTG